MTFGPNETCPVCFGKRTIRAIKLHPVHVFEYVEEPCSCAGKVAEISKLIDAAIEAPVSPKAPETCDAANCYRDRPCAPCLANPPRRSWPPEMTNAPQPGQLYQVQPGDMLTHSICLPTSGSYGAPLMLVNEIRIVAPGCENDDLREPVSMTFFEFGQAGHLTITMVGGTFHTKLEVPPLRVDRIAKLTARYVVNVMLFGMKL